VLGTQNFIFSEAFFIFSEAFLAHFWPFRGFSGTFLPLTHTSSAIVKDPNFPSRHRATQPPTLRRSAIGDRDTSRMLERVLRTSREQTEYRIANARNTSSLRKLDSITSLTRDWRSAPGFDAWLRRTPNSPICHFSHFDHQPPIALPPGSVSRDRF